MASAEVRTGNFTLSPSLHVGYSPSIIPLPYLPSSSFSRRWASTAVSIHSALKEQAPSDTYLLKAFPVPANSVLDSYGNFITRHIYKVCCFLLRVLGGMLTSFVCSFLRSKQRSVRARFGCSASA